MRFDNAQECEQLIYSLKEADLPREKDRANINAHFNGVPPYTEAEVAENQIFCNVNYLEGTRLSHDARSQFTGAFLKPGKFFTATTDMGPRHKRQARSAAFTRNINRIMKRSLPYYENFRSKIASLVLHGISPVVWDNESTWCPDSVPICDVLVPARTLLTMKNLPVVAFFHSYTAPEMIRLTRGPRVDPAWNTDLVDDLIEHIDKQAYALMGSNWPELWSPEKQGERMKGDGSVYSFDTVPTIDCWDVYSWDDDGKTSGFERRMIIDAWSGPQGGGGMKAKYDRKFDFAKGKFLYNSKRRKVASKVGNLAAWQFADLSAVGPFQYHNARGMGYLLYAVCEIQNRLRCRFTEAVFENLMMLLRANSQDEVEKALKVNLHHLGFIPEDIKIVPQSDRHQINTELVQWAMMENGRIINENTQSYRSNFQEQGSQRKNQFQVMAEQNATTALVNAAFMQAYEYQKHEFFEIVRRFCRKRSRDAEVNEFRGACLRDGIPSNMLVPEAWDCEPERVMGAGNKPLEMHISETLMQYRQLYDPDAQRDILRDFTLSITDDPARATALVPEAANKVTDSIHDAELSATSLLAGIQMGLKQGVNHQEYAGTLLQSLIGQIQKIAKRGGVGRPDEIAGMQNLAGMAINGQKLPGNGIANHIAILAEDKESKAIVKQLGDVLGKAMNQVKAFAQRLQEQQQKAQANGGGMDAETKAKIQGTLAIAKVKADNAAQSHAQRTAQRQLQFQQEMKQRAAEHRMKVREEHVKGAHELALSQAEHAIERRNKMDKLNESE